MQAGDVFAGFLATSQTCQVLGTRHLRNGLTNWHPILNLSLLYQYYNIFHLLVHCFNPFMSLFVYGVDDLLAWILTFPPYSRFSDTVTGRVDFPGPEVWQKVFAVKVGKPLG
jgi:hypothetical protein